MNLDIHNSAKGWQDFLEALAAEAERDRDTTDPQFAMFNTLNDLALVARSYAARIETDRGTEVRQPVAVDAAATQRDSLKAPLDGETPATQAVPGWLLDTLADMSAQIGALEERVAYLERNQNLTTIAPSSAYLIESANVDEDPAAWDDIDRARAALRGMVARQHRERAASRQKILERVSSLAASPDRNASSEAEIRQHQTRAEELGQIDAIAGAKMDEIAALDDLTLAREYAAGVKEGWPQ